MRISFVLAKAGLSGGVKSNRLMAEALGRRGHEVTIYYAAGPEPWPPPWRPRALLQHARLWRRQRGQLHSDHHLSHSAVPVMAVPQPIVRAQDVGDADGVVASWWKVAEAVRLWPSSKGILVYYIRHHELHGGDPERVRATYRMPVQKVVISNWLRKVMEEEYGCSNVPVIPNGVDWDQFDSPERVKRVVPRVGFLFGRQRWKGAHTALAATRLLQKAIPELEVVSFGSTEPPRALELPRNFAFHLRPAQSRIPGIYQSTDCWLVPSITEGLGMPGLEAAASHCPLVVTRSGGPEDYVEQGQNGFVVPVEDEESMAEAMGKVLSAEPHSWAAMSAASYRIARRFNWDLSAQRLEAVLLDLLGSASHG